MSEIPELEARIVSALARIQAGVAQMQPAGASPQVQPDAKPAVQVKGDAETPAAAEAQPAAEPAQDPAPDTASQDRIAELSAKLDEEQTANAQLEERVKLLKERQDGKLAELEASVDASRGRAARMDRELQRLRQVNAELRANNTQLREAVASGVSEPHLINKAMMAELDALRATQSADAAEMDAIMDELTPLIEKEARDATS